MGKLVGIHGGDEFDQTTCQSSLRIHVLDRRADSILWVDEIAHFACAQVEFIRLVDGRGAAKRKPRRDASDDGGGPRSYP